VPSQRQCGHALWSHRTEVLLCRGLTQYVQHLLTNNEFAILAENAAATFKFLELDGDLLSRGPHEFR
jgi:hypothetical protein